MSLKKPGSQKAAAKVEAQPASKAEKETTAKLPSRQTTKQITAAAEAKRKDLEKKRLDRLRKAAEQNLQAIAESSESDPATLQEETSVQEAPVPQPNTTFQSVSLPKAPKTKTQTAEHGKLSWEEVQADIARKQQNANRATIPDFSAFFK